MGLLGDGLAVLGTANSLSVLNAMKAGTINQFLLSMPGMTALPKVGMRLAAVGGNLVKGIFLWRDAGGQASAQTFNKFAFQMNPEEIEEQIEPDWAEIRVPGQNRPVYQFVHGGRREIKFTLNFFYADRNRAKIRDYIRVLQGLATRPNIQRQTVAAIGAPPTVYFYFGRYIQGDRFIVSSVESRVFDMFDPILLLPLRAEVQIRLLEAADTRLADPLKPKVTFNDTGGGVGAILRGGF